ncbi:GNAT family N-acetyltransferase [Demetria terragena]|uniref:GNAT family N-acetyltransferase n=1 Tax=Demetria terragena TaxID=63959 RepID=UPI00039D96C9|nr:N-acetyltransferase [Demetria terragena]
MSSQIRPVQSGEYSAAEQVITDAFNDPNIAGMVRAIRESSFYWPELELAAMRDGQVVGHVMVSGATLRHAAGERTVAMLSPLATAPGRQRSGVGTALVAAVVETAEQRGEPLVILEGSPDFYGRRGFTSASAAGITIPIPDWAPPEAAQVALLGAYDENDSTWRGEVIYPPAVAALGH